MTARIGIVGAGLAARSHALDIVTDPSMELAGVVSRSTRAAIELSELFGGVVYPDLGSLISAPAIDAMVVAVPTPVVLDVAEQILDRKPCLVEKPVATTTAELRRLDRLSSLCPSMIAPFTRRYQPTTQLTAKLVRSGELGEIVSVGASWRGPYRSRFDSGASTYRAATALRHGVLVDTGSHALDIVSHLVGGLHPPTQVSGCFTTNERGAEVEVFLRIRAGTTIRLSLVDEPDTVDCGGWTVSVLTENGSVRLSNTGAVIHMGSYGPRHIPIGPTQRPTTDLVRLLDGGEPMGTPLAEVLALSKTIVRAYADIGGSSLSWIRPRGKALGRLNGAC